MHAYIIMTLILCYSNIVRLANTHICMFRKNILCFTVDIFNSSRAYHKIFFFILSSRTHFGRVLITIKVIVYFIICDAIGYIGYF